MGMRGPHTQIFKGVAKMEQAPQHLLYVVFGLILAPFIILAQWMLQYAYKMKKLSKSIPTVPGLFFLGSVFDFISATPWDLMTMWHEKYGPIYCFGLIGRWVAVGGGVKRRH